MGTADVVPVCVADVCAGAAVGGVGVDWIFAVRGISASADDDRGQGYFGRIGAVAGGAAVPEDPDDRENFGTAVDRRGGNDPVADLGRSAALRSEAGV